LGVGRWINNPALYEARARFGLYSHMMMMMMMMMKALALGLD
jgi:hypothetical protein